MSSLNLFIQKYLKTRARNFLVSIKAQNFIYGWIINTAHVYPLPESYASLFSRQFVKESASAFPVIK